MWSLRSVCRGAHEETQRSANKGELPLWETLGRISLVSHGIPFSDKPLVLFLCVLDIFGLYFFLSNLIFRNDNAEMFAMVISAGKAQILGIYFSLE